VGQKVLSCFLEVNTARQSSGFGPLPISYTELQAWCSLMDEKLSPWEVSMFRLLDNIYLDEANKKSQEGSS